MTPPPLDILSNNHALPDDDPLAKLLDTATPSLRAAIIANPALLRSLTKLSHRAREHRHHKSSSSQRRRPDTDDATVLALEKEERQNAQLRSILKVAEERLAKEVRRANEAEAKLREAEATANAMAVARQKAERQAEKAKEEVKWYKMQLTAAAKEITRAQQELDLLEEERAEAEEAAARARHTSRKLTEELKMRDAREKGRKEGRAIGLKEGMELGRSDGFIAGRKEGHSEARHESVKPIRHALEYPRADNSVPPPVPPKSKHAVQASTSSSSSSSSSPSALRTHFVPRETIIVHEPAEEDPVYIPSTHVPSQIVVGSSAPEPVRVTQQGPGGVPFHTHSPTASEHRFEHRRRNSRSDRSTPLSELALLNEPEIIPRPGLIHRSDLSDILETESNSPAPTLARHDSTRSSRHQRPSSAQGTLSDRVISNENVRRLEDQAETYVLPQPTAATPHKGHKREGSDVPTIVVQPPSRPQSNLSKMTEHTSTHHLSPQSAHEPLPAPDPPSPPTPPALIGGATFGSNARQGPFVLPPQPETILVLPSGDENHEPPAHHRTPVPMAAPALPTPKMAGAPHPPTPSYQPAPIPPHVQYPGPVLPKSLLDGLRRKVWPDEDSDAPSEASGSPSRVQPARAFLESVGHPATSPGMPKSILKTPGSLKSIPIPLESSSRATPGMPKSILKTPNAPPVILETVPEPQDEEEEEEAKFVPPPPSKKKMDRPNGKKKKR